MLQFSCLALGFHLRLCPTADIDLSLGKFYIGSRNGKRRGWPKLDASDYGNNGTSNRRSVGFTVEDYHSFLYHVHSDISCVNDSLSKCSAAKYHL